MVSVRTMGRTIECDVCGESDIDVAEVIKRYDVGYNSDGTSQIGKYYLCDKCSFNIQLFINEIGGEEINAADGAEY